MKKTLPLFFVLFSMGAIAQPIANCSMMCVLDITLDTANNEMEVLFFNGDSVMINYPTVQVIDQNGDTVGNPQGTFTFFGHPQGTMLHEIPTTLTSLPQPFTCTVLMTDQVWDTTCVFQYPMSCPMNVLKPDQRDQFEVYPNPASEALTIMLPSRYSGKTEVHITNMLGEVFAGTMIAHNGQMELSVKDLAAGVYFVTVLVGDERYVQKIVRE
jgi:hypothetical protein